jgi:ADP-ribose pyrophosphatase YjhB (NUDIX family)
MAASRLSRAGSRLAQYNEETETIRDTKECSVTQVIDSADLRLLVEGIEPAAIEHLVWHGGQIELDLSLYLTTRTPPPDLTSSGRCIILAGDRVLLMTNPGGEHILPGGRVQPGEDIPSATMRELSEETGLDNLTPEPIAALVYTHTTPKPEIYPYPYPIFIHAVYIQRLPEPFEVIVNDTYELAGEFVPIAEALDRIPEHQRVLLNAVIRHDEPAMAETLV